MNGTSADARVVRTRELVRAAADFARPVVRQFIAAIVGDAGHIELITELVADAGRRAVASPACGRGG